MKTPDLSHRYLGMTGDSQDYGLTTDLPLCFRRIKGLAWTLIHLKGGGECEDAIVAVADAIQLEAEDAEAILDAWWENTKGSQRTLEEAKEAS